jgi:hypothetical protein
MIPDVHEDNGGQYGANQVKCGYVYDWCFCVATQITFIKAPNRQTTQEENKNLRNKMILLIKMLFLLGGTSCLIYRDEIIVSSKENRRNRK